MAQFKDEGVSEEEISLPEETVLMSREISLGHNGSRGGTRISASLANQCRVLKKLSIVPGNVQEVLLMRISVAVTLDKEKS